MERSRKFSLKEKNIQSCHRNTQLGQDCGIKSQKKLVGWQN